MFLSSNPMHHFEQAFEVLLPLSQHLVNDRDSEGFTATWAEF
jgi:hypothetical protein